MGIKTTALAANKKTGRSFFVQDSFVSKRQDAVRKNSTHWQVNNERRPLTGLADGSNGSSVVGNHFLNNGQPNARTGILAFGMQPLKDLKNPIQVHFIEADTIVFDAYLVVHEPPVAWVYS